MSASKANQMPHRSQMAPPSAARNASPSVPTSIANKLRSPKEDVLKAEVEKLREQLKQAHLEKSEINSEYEKLSTICRSQRQQLHAIKQALASTTPPNKLQHQGFLEDPSGSCKPIRSHHNNSFAATTDLNASQHFGGPTNNQRNLTSQPPGWAAF